MIAKLGDLGYQESELMTDMSNYLDFGAPLKLALMGWSANPLAAEWSLNHNPTGGTFTDVQDFFFDNPLINAQNGIKGPLMAHLVTSALYDVTIDGNVEHYNMREMVDAALDGSHVSNDFHDPEGDAQTYGSKIRPEVLAAAQAAGMDTSLFEDMAALTAPGSEDRVAAVFTKQDRGTAPSVYQLATTKDGVFAWALIDFVTASEHRTGDPNGGVEIVIETGKGTIDPGKNNNRPGIIASLSNNILVNSHGTALGNNLSGTQANSN
jgi:hypothetical protein